MKVLLLSRYDSLGASSRVRLYQYLPYLRSQSIEVTVAPLLGNDYIDDLNTGRPKHLLAIIVAYLRRLGYLLKSRQFDLLWIEKEIYPWLPAWGEALLERLGIPYVVDYDDAVFHRYDMHENAIVRIILSKKIDTVMKRAALVIVGNDYLADRAQRAGAKRIEYLPSVIDLDKYSIVPRIQNSFFTIGWIGSPVTAKYLSLISSIISEIFKDSNIRLVLVGSGDIKLEGVSFEVRDWKEQTEVADIQSFDVGIMPLPDEPWERGKCGYKLIQYMACGLPVVASPVGVNQKIVEHGVNGFLASNSEEWAQALNALRENVELKERMGKSGRMKVVSQYCVQVTAPRLAELLRSLVKGSK